MNLRDVFPFEMNFAPGDETDSRSLPIDRAFLGQTRCGSKMQRTAAAGNVRIVNLVRFGFAGSGDLPHFFPDQIVREALPQQVVVEFL